MNEKKYDLMAPIKTAPGGKTVWLRIGWGRVKPDGAVSVFVAALPAAHVGWDGWANLFERRDDENHAAQKQLAENGRAVTPGASTPPDDDIPF